MFVGGGVQIIGGEYSSRYEECKQVGGDWYFPAHRWGTRVGVKFCQITGAGAAGLSAGCAIHDADASGGGHARAVLLGCGELRRRCASPTRDASRCRRSRVSTPEPLRRKKHLHTGYPTAGTNCSTSVRKTNTKTQQQERSVKIWIPISGNNCNNFYIFKFFFFKFILVVIECFSWAVKGVQHGFVIFFGHALLIVNFKMNF